MMDSQLSFTALEKQAIARLQKASIPDAQRDARLLIQAATKLDRAALMAREHEPCDAEVTDCMKQFIERRIAREPVFRIIGEREFHGLPLKLNEATLEPRDDTECLIESCLSRIADKSKPLRFLDLGTGTGAIALALLSELPNARAVATDKEARALKAARENAVNLGLDSRFETLQSDWFADVNGKFDFIVSNPPYIKSEVVDGLEPEVIDHDPRLALDGGSDGLAAYRQIFAGAGNVLHEEGFLAVEIGFDQLHEVVDCAAQSGWVLLDNRQDLAGQDRALMFELTGAA